MIDRPLRVLSLGAGVQSTRLLLGSLMGEFPKLDAAIFADTKWERAATYEHLRRLQQVCTVAGVPILVVSNGNLRDSALDPNVRFASIPLHVANQDGTKGMIRRQCTSEYKLVPIRKALRSLAGLEPRQRSAAVLVEQWKGISSDEWQRMSDPDFSWIVNRYPLVEERITRWDCERWLSDHWPWAVPRSSCLACPFHNDHEWRSLRENPAEWADAVDFDRRVRFGNARAEADPIRGAAFVHDSLVPLDKADLSTPEDHGQGSLFVNECAGVCGV